jgi:hypothetical protein
MMCQAAKRGGIAIRLLLDNAMLITPQQDVDIVALDAALTRLIPGTTQSDRFMTPLFIALSPYD